MEVKFSSLVKRSLAQGEDNSSVAISDPRFLYRAVYHHSQEASVLKSPHDPQIVTSAPAIISTTQTAERKKGQR